MTDTDTNKPHAGITREKAVEPELGQGPIDGFRYNSADFAALEWEQMWTKVWLVAGRVDQLINSGELTEQLAFRDRLIEEIQNASTTINTLRNADQEDAEAIAEINDGMISKGEIFELRDSNGNIIHRFSTEDPEALTAVINATSTPEAKEQD